MHTVRLAAAQLGPNEGNGNIFERICDLLEQASLADVELVVFPELALTPYFARWRPFESLGFAVTDRTLESRVQQACKEIGVDAVLPLARESNANLVNSAAVIDREGELLGFYDKLHLPHTIENSEFPIYEREWFVPGGSLPTFELNFGTIGVQICYDRHFPEGFAMLAERGASVIALSSNSPLYGSQASWRRRAWMNLCRVRAAENHSVIVASCKAGKEYGWDYIGNSCIVDSKGNVLALAETNDDELVVASVSQVAASKPAQFASG